MPDPLLEVLNAAAGAVQKAVGSLDRWDTVGSRPDQYAVDVVADAAAFDVLESAGFGVLSEERAAHRLDRDVVVVLDPVDGSTNAIRGLPYYATSLCAVDRDGMAAAVVLNLATGMRFEAVRDRGATCDGLRLQTSACTSVAQAAVALSGPQTAGRPWAHMRALGATALELCDVARGTLDAYINTDVAGVAPWDYLGALLVCLEAGASAAEAADRPLVTLRAGERRSPRVAATPPLLDDIAAHPLA